VKSFLSCFILLLYFFVCWDVWYFKDVWICCILHLCLSDSLAVCQWCSVILQHIRVEWLVFSWLRHTAGCWVAVQLINASHVFPQRLVRDCLVTCSVPLARACCILLSFTIRLWLDVFVEPPATLSSGYHYILTSQPALVAFWNISIFVCLLCCYFQPPTGLISNQVSWRFFQTRCGMVCRGAIWHGAALPLLLSHWNIPYALYCTAAAHSAMMYHAVLNPLWKNLKTSLTLAVHMLILIKSYSQ